MQGRTRSWRKSEGIVVARDPAIHPPVAGCDGGTKADQDIDVVQYFGTNLIFIVQKHLNEVDGVDIICSGSKCLRNPDDRVLAHAILGRRPLANDFYLISCSIRDARGNRKDVVCIRLTS